MPDLHLCVTVAWPYIVFFTGVMDAQFWCVFAGGCGRRDLGVVGVVEADDAVRVGGDRHRFREPFVDRGVNVGFVPRVRCLAFMLVVFSSGHSQLKKMMLLGAHYAFSRPNARAHG